MKDPQQKKHPEELNFAARGKKARAFIDPLAGEASRKGIKDVARQLGVTQRTLRFYEDKGLINPERAGNTRIYSRRDIGRMQLILRGKRLGFSIREVKEFLDLYDADPEQVEQMSRLIERIRKRLAELEKQQMALEETIRELTQIEREAAARLQSLNSGAVPVDPS